MFSSHLGQILESIFWNNNSNKKHMIIAWTSISLEIDKRRFWEFETVADIQQVPSLINEIL